MKVSAVIPNRDGDTLIERCLASLAAGGAVSETIVIDDGSTDGSDARAAALGARVVRSPGSGFAAAVNHGAAVASGDAVLVVNTDAFVFPGAVARLSEALETRPGLALCAAGLESETGERARSFGTDLTLWRAIRLALSSPPNPPPERKGAQEVEFVPLACALVRRADWEAVGGLDERFPFYFEDHDLCWRLRVAGRRLAVRWDARAIHLEGGSTRAHGPHPWFERYHAARLRYLRKRYPRGWLLYVAVWAPSALAHAALWLLRGLRGQPGASGWAAAYLRSAFAGVGPPKTS